MCSLLLTGSAMSVIDAAWISFRSDRIAIAVSDTMSELISGFLSRHLAQIQIQSQFAPKLCSAIRNSLTAVSTSSKLRAEIAHLACFCAAITLSSSVL